MRSGFLGGLALLVGSLASCGGGNSLDGTWTGSGSTFGISFTYAVTFDSDGTATSKTSACGGSETKSGYMWSSTATTVTVSGVPSCSGSFTCTVDGLKVTSDCSGTTPSAIGGTCDYVLSSDGNTLTLDHCTGSTAVPDGGEDAGSSESASVTLTRSS